MRVRTVSTGREMVREWSFDGGHSWTLLPPPPKTPTLTVLNGGKGGWELDEDDWDDEQIYPVKGSA